MESVRCTRAVCRRIGKRIDDLQLLDDRAGPSVRDDERQRIFMFRTNVNEMNVQPIDLGDELRQGVQFCLTLAPVVICHPVVREFLHGRELHALRLIANGFLLRPSCCLNPAAKVGERLIREAHTKRTNRILVICLLASALCSGGLSHGCAPYQIALDFVRG